MSHGGMTQAVVLPYEALIHQENIAAARRDEMDRLRRRNRLNQLREEYRHIRSFKVTLTHPQTGQVNTSYSLEELFEMFTLTQDWRDAVL
jgi:hypothetical protein